MNSFLGLVNYFRDHIPRFEEIVRPLRDIVKAADKSARGGRDESRKLSKKQKRTRLSWNSKAEQAWVDIKKAIAECPTLFFLQNEGKILLFTDASDYGYGAYLCQEDANGLLRPVALMSHAFNGVQQRWSTFEKEGYAIFQAFKEFALFIRDRHFSLRTDHRNLIYIGSDTSSAKVQRWKLFMQDYDFDVEHIAGESNTVADGLSRFVFRSYKEEQVPHSAPQLLAAVTRIVKVTPDQRKLIEATHNATVGHHGVERTLYKLHSQGHSWVGMRSHVREFIQNCPTCQKLNFERPPVVAEPFTLATYKPHELLYVDTIGPLPPSQDERRKDPYLHILVIVDAFTRYVNLYPLDSLDADEALGCFQHYFADNPLPKKILSDNGSQFVNASFKAYLAHRKVAHEFTLAYSKEENGMVERQNREVLRHLRAFIYDRRVRDTWHKHVYYVQEIINSVPSTAHGQCPCDLKFPNVSQHSVEHRDFLDLARNEPTSAAAVHSWHLRNSGYHQDLIDIAAQLQRDLDEEHYARTLNLEPTVFPDGSWVLAMPHRGRGGVRFPDTKAKSFWSGPYRVTSHLGNTYTVHNVIDDKPLDFHVTSLKAFRFDPDHVDPKLIACGDEQEFHVERVLRHSWADAPPTRRTNRRPPARSRRDLFFEIRWLGFDEHEDSWEPWKNVRLVAVVQAYCRQHPELRHLVANIQPAEVAVEVAAPPV
jgi:transposase InsO family protein